MNGYAVGNIDGQDRQDRMMELESVPVVRGVEGRHYMAPRTTIDEQDRQDRVVVELESVPQIPRKNPAYPVYLC